MKTAILVLIVALAAYFWHLSEIKRLTVAHHDTLAAEKKAGESRFITLTEDYEALRAERDHLQSELDRLTAAPRPSIVPALPASVPTAVAPNPAPAAPAAAPVVDPGAEAAANRVRRAALESQIATAKATLKDWRRKADIEEQEWQNHTTGIRLSPTERAKRRAEIDAAIAAKEAELLRLQSQLASLPR